MTKIKAATEYDGVRSSIEKKMSFIYNAARNHAAAPLDYGTVQAYLAELAMHNDTLNAQFADICTLKPADQEVYDKEYAQMWSLQIRASQKLRSLELKPPVTTNSGSGSSGSNENTSHSVRLPRLDLPNFDGDLLEWTTFKDMFEAAVDNNTNLSKVQKFSYLKAKLTGEAARVVKDFALTDVGYDIAWKALQERYHHPRKIMDALIAQHMTVPAANGSAQTIRKLIDSTKQIIRTFELLGKTIDDGGKLIISILLVQKFDAEMTWQWQRTLKDKNYPEIDSILEFMELYADAEQTNELVFHTRRGKQTSSHHTSKNKPSNDKVQKKFDKSCKVGCKDSHPVFKCKKFQSLDLAQRQEVIKKHRLCFRCFGYGHGTRTCKRKIQCETCSSKGHNTLMHDEKYQKKTAKTMHTQADSGTSSDGSQD